MIWGRGVKTAGQSIFGNLALSMFLFLSVLEFKGSPPESSPLTLTSLPLGLTDLPPLPHTGRTLISSGLGNVFLPRAFSFSSLYVPCGPPNYPIPQPKAASALKKLFHPTHLSSLPLNTIRDGELRLSRASFCRPYNLCGSYSTLPLWL